MNALVIFICDIPSETALNVIIAKVPCSVTGFSAEDTPLIQHILPFILSIFIIDWLVRLYKKSSNHVSNIPPLLTFIACKTEGLKEMLHIADVIGSTGIIVIFIVKFSPTFTNF